jgi:hypothetical protein
MKYVLCGLTINMRCKSCHKTHLNTRGKALEAAPDSDFVGRHICPACDHGLAHDQMATRSFLNRFSETTN